MHIYTVYTAHQSYIYASDRNKPSHVTSHPIGAGCHGYHCELKTCPFIASPRRIYDATIRHCVIKPF